MNLSLKRVNPNLSQRVRAALLSKGLHLQDWARAEGIALSQVSAALHGRRVDARSRMIRAELEKLIGGDER